MVKLFGLNCPALIHTQDAHKVQPLYTNANTLGKIAARFWISQIVL